MGVLEAALIGGAVGAVVGVVYALSTSGGEDEKDKDKDKDKDGSQSEDSDRDKKQATAAQNVQLRRFLVPPRAGAESRRRPAPADGFVLRF